jgi:hypothetical protein
MTAASSVESVEAVVLMEIRGSWESGEVVHRGAFPHSALTGERLASTRAGQSRFHVVQTETIQRPLKPMDVAHLKQPMGTRQAIITTKTPMISIRVAG